MRRKKLSIVCALALFAIGLAVATVASVWVVHRSSRQRVFDDPATVPVNDVGLVLGTSPLTAKGERNPHFDNRMAAAAELYHAGKVRHLLLTGDNGTRGYDEPADMQAALAKLGVPPQAMTLDDAGFRTLDSVMRARRVFGQTRLTVITDRFHVYRAVFLARHQGIDAIAFPSRDVDVRSSLKTRVRECGADLKACLDLWVLHTRPRFLGEPIPVRIAGR